jgi:RHS repeat-associated protein
MRKPAIHDIQGLYSETRQSMDVLYTYDAWGVPTFHNQIPIIGTSDLGKLNHVMTGMLYELTNQLTYRGYFYDFETGLYYLQSRYYAPNWGRFINADKHFDTGDGILGTNMYIYCNDNPVMYTDPNGEGAVDLLVISATKTTIYIGETTTVTIKHKVNSVKFTYVGWAWDSCVDSANSDGKTSVTFTGKGSGTATITAFVSYNNLPSSYESIDITVLYQPVTGVSLSSKNVAKHQTDAAFTLTPTISPANASYRNVTWSSNNTAVATVSAKGVVTPVARGRCTITVTTEDGSKTAKCHVTLGWYADNTNWGTTGTKTEQKQNAIFIYDYLRNKGWTKNAICAILGNMQYESGINPGRWQNGNIDVNNGYGLVQWTPSTKYLNNRGDYGETSIRGQLERIIYEKENNVQWDQNNQTRKAVAVAYGIPSMTFKTFTTSTESVGTLAKAFILFYECPSVVINAYYGGTGHQTTDCTTELNLRANAAIAWNTYFTW